MSMQAPEVVMTDRSLGNAGGLDRAVYTGDEASAPFRNVGAARMAFIPAFLRKPLSKIWGYCLVLLVILGAVSLSTWTISDPSLTFANGSVAENWLGFWGASFADFTMQFLGFAAIAFLIPPLVWGLFKIFGHALPAFAMRAGWWVGSLVIICAALACLSVPTGWPLQVGLGGVVGDAVLSIPRAFIGAYPSGIFAAILFVAFTIPGVWMLIRASHLHRGLPRHTAGEAQAPGDTADVDMMMENEFGMDADLAQPEEKEGFDWGALIAMPVGLVMHLVYSAGAFWQKKKAQRAVGPMVQQPMVDMHHAPAVQPDMRAEPEFCSSYAEADNGFAADPHYQDATFDDGAFEGLPPETHAYEAGLEPEVVQQPSAGLDRPRVAAPSVSPEDDDVPIPHTDAAQPPNPVNRVARRVKPKTSKDKFILPELELLSEQKAMVEDPSLSNEALEENARLLEGVLEDFGVKGQILKVRPGPVVTLYELEPAPGVKSSRVIGLAEDIARSMSAIAARVAVVPGRNAIGIELPNKRRETVYLREQLSSPEFKKTKAKLAMCLGKNIGGEPVIADLAKMPHLLMAGTTGSGKSVGINTMILSLLYRLGPDKCKMIMIDPKMLELSIYDGIPHLLTPVVVDPKKAVVALKWTVREMEERYKKMSKVGVRNIDGFNTRIADAAAKGEVITRTVQTGFDRETGEAIYEHEELDLEPMPFIVVIIDEMADLMMVAGKDIEGTVQRLAQMARAAGIHVIMATQRPSVDVITGTIKANFPTRISFQVTSKIDSRTILGEMGAEQLLGMGDMLYMAGGGRITRVHGPFVDDQEVEDVVNHLKAQGVPQYLEAVTEEEEEEEGEVGGAGAAGGGNLSDSADPYDQAVAIVLRDRKASTSYIQRRLSVGYNKAASLIERMEQEGLISPANHAGKREILVPAEDETI